jgi:hypothetical protein
MNKQEIFDILERSEITFNEQFAILKQISNLLLSENTLPHARELALRCMEKEHLFVSTMDLLNLIMRELEYFPYIEQQGMSLSDSIAYEFHRPENLCEIMKEKDIDFVFHHQQYMIYQKLLDGKSVVLSAPTSFGKSKIIDALIAEEKFSNIVIIVPTLALIDETRRRLGELFSKKYNIVAHPNQQISNEKNIFILTQERVIAMKAKLPKIDFMVVDEFYKIDYVEDDEDPKRMVALNEAIYYVLKKFKVQFYMLGPSIESISEDIIKHYEFEFVKSDYNTVVTDIHRYKAKTGEKRLAELFSDPEALKEAVIKVKNDDSLINKIKRKLGGK